MSWLQLGLFDHPNNEPHATVTHQVDVEIDSEGMPSLRHILSGRYLIKYSAFVLHTDAEYVRDEFEKRCDLDAWWKEGCQNYTPVHILNHCHKLLNRRLFGSPLYQNDEEICRDCLRPAEICKSSVDRCDLAGYDIGVSDSKPIVRQCPDCLVDLEYQDYDIHWESHVFLCPSCGHQYSARTSLSSIDRSIFG